MIINLFMSNLICRCWIGSEDSMGSVLSLPVPYLRVFQSYSALWHHYISEFMVFPYLQLHSDDRIVLIWFFPPSDNCYEEFLLWSESEIQIAYTVNSFALHYILIMFLSTYVCIYKVHKFHHKDHHKELKLRYI